MFLIGGMLFVGPVVGMLAALPFLPHNLEAIKHFLLTPTQEPVYKNAFLILQAGNSLGWLILTPWLYLRVVKKTSLRSCFKRFAPLPRPLLLTFILGIMVMIVNSPVIEWNKQVHFPEFMSGFEQWARAQENMLARVTELLTQFDSFGQFILAFAVISLIAGFAEEFFFRGVLQKHLQQYFNPHAAIWTTAILFSAIHLQFFGFVPRMLLGAFFGYLYYYSGSLFYPMFAHALNNGASVFFVYMIQQSGNPQPAAEEPSFPLYASALAFFSVIILFFYYKKYWTELMVRTEKNI